MNERPATLELRVRLLPEPCLWCWEIVDRHRCDVLVHSSWAGEWTAYESSEEALAAGCTRLAELRSTGTGGANAENRRKGGGAV